MIDKLRGLALPAALLAPMAIGVALPLLVRVWLLGHSPQPIDLVIILLLLFGLYPLAFSLIVGERWRPRAPAGWERAIERAAELTRQPIAGLQPGEAVVIGHVSGGESLRSPLGDRPCVWYSLAVTDFQENPLAPFFRNRSVAPFEVDDGSGARALVVPHDALIRTPLTPEANERNGRFAELRLDYLRRAGFRPEHVLVEHVLTIGDKVLVAGRADGGADPYRSGALAFESEPPPGPPLFVTHESQATLVGEVVLLRKLRRSSRRVFWVGALLTAAGVAVQVGTVVAGLVGR